jgi:4-aminobutyrate aminotransferase-like enzyme
MERGLLLNPVKPNAIRFMPPLTIVKKDIDAAISILDKALAKS